MFDQDILDQINSRCAKARSGYVKSYKNWSIVTTVQDMAHVMTRERIANIVHSCYDMEGIDEACTNDVIKMLTDRFVK